MKRETGSLTRSYSPRPLRRLVKSSSIPLGSETSALGRGDQDVKPSLSSFCSPSDPGITDEVLKWGDAPQTPELELSPVELGLTSKAGQRLCVCGTRGTKGLCLFMTGKFGRISANNKVLPSRVNQES
jgi:hypothetical protein